MDPEVLLRETLRVISEFGRNILLSMESLEINQLFHTSNQVFKIIVVDLES